MIHREELLEDWRPRRRRSRRCRDYCFMYWDVVEVKPEPAYRLFVRFEDGLNGNVQLQPEKLTGALAPLLDAQFFEQVFIDHGAVAWPGEIDLAPDAMYAQVANQSRELGRLLVGSRPRRARTRRTHEQATSRR